MRKILFLLCFLAPVLALCGGKNNLSGNWKEVSRKNAGSTIAYTDTIKIEFLTGNEYIWQKANAIMQKGTYVIQGNTLDMAIHYFTILEHTNNKLILKEAETVYELAAYTPAKNTPEVKRQEVYKPVNNIQQMAGHWSKYKSTNAEQKKQIDYSRQIKTVDIFPAQQDGKWGSFYAGNDASNAPSWFVESYSNQTIFCNGKDRRQFKVIKGDKGELILEENGTTYFFKEFK